jgi:uncharacterized protein
MEFEWDAAKAERNLLKHDVDFAQATKIFDDPRLRQGIDPRHRRETRHQAIGSVNGVVLFVAHTDAGRNLSHHQRQEGKPP